MTKSQPTDPKPTGVAPVVARRARRRRRWWLLWSPLLVSLTLAGAWVGVQLQPEALRARFTTLLTERLAVPVEVGAVRFAAPNEFHVHQVRILAPPGATRQECILEFPLAILRVDGWALLSGGDALADVQVQQPRIYAERLADGSLNLTHMLRPGPESKVRPPDITIEGLALYLSPDNLFRSDEPIVFAKASLIAAPDTSLRLSAQGRHPQLGAIDVSGTVSSDGALEFRTKASGSVADLLARTHAELARQLATQYALDGAAEFTIDAKRAAGTEVVQLALQVGITAGALRFHKFDYPVSDIAATLAIHASIGVRANTTPIAAVEVQLEDLKGRHGESQLTMQTGSVQFWSDGKTRLDLALHSPNLRIDDDLRAALSPSTAELFAALGLGGTVSADVRIATSTHDTVEVSVDAQVADQISVHARPIHYPLVFRSGRVRFDSQARVTRFDEFESEPFAGAVLKLSGEDSPDPGAPLERATTVVQLRIEPASADGAGLALDDELLSASLPSDLRSVGERLGLNGAIAGEMTGDYHRAIGAGANALGDEFRYEGRARLSSLAGHFGVAMREIDADVSFVGTLGMSDDAPSRFTANLTGGSFSFDRFRVRDVAAEFKFAPESQPLVPRKNHEGERPRLRVLLQNADLYEGTLRGRLSIDFGRNPEFVAQATFDGVDLGVAAADVFDSSTVLGRAAGEVVMTGVPGDSNSLAGHGRLSIDRAKLSQLPLVASFLTVLANPLTAYKWLDAENREYTSADVGFQIRDRKFLVRDSEDFVLRSEIAHLKLSGEMDFERNCDFDVALETQSSIWGIGTLIDRASRQRFRGSLQTGANPFEEK